MTDARVLEAVIAPHLADAELTTRRMMLDVLIGCVPVAVAATWVFGAWALAQLATAVGAALATEWACGRLRGRPSSIFDGSAAITGAVLAFSLPPALPLPMTALGGVVAIALGKMVFGGLGQNTFNPAMVGRAFLMACFPARMSTWTLGLDGASVATPLVATPPPPLMALVTGDVAGCLGETSAALIVLGGLWLLVRRAADWRLTAGTLLVAATLAAAEQLLRPDAALGVTAHLLSGGLLLGAFFIVTDPVSTPLSARGRWVYGGLVGALTMIIRIFGAYPEGVMFAVLLASAATPLIDRTTVPRPIGGHVERLP